MKNQTINCKGKEEKSMEKSGFSESNQGEASLSRKLVGLHYAIRQKVYDRGDDVQVADVVAEVQQAAKENGLSIDSAQLITEKWNGVGGADIGQCADRLADALVGKLQHPTSTEHPQGGPATIVDCPAWISEEK